MQDPVTGTPLALTQGDPAGIGPEITLRAWRAAAGPGHGAGVAPGLPAFFVIGDPALYAATARRLGLEVPLAAIDRPEAAAGLFARALPVLPLEAGPGDVAPGVPDGRTAPGTIESIAHAVALVRAGRAGAVVTNPIAKHVLTAAGFAHPGHTEFLAALARDASGGPPPRPVMMLWCETLAVVPITVHIPLRAAPDALTPDLVVATARIVDADLRGRFGIARPRLALAGLNPHAGEAGTMGLEERDVLAPAVARLRAEGIAIGGPFPADTLFHARARATYDAALCPTHDQALIPIKTIAFDEGVNVTLGLPFIRTSPDHGTAFDIAGRGIARPDSLIAAIRLAGRLAAGPTTPAPA